MNLHLIFYVAVLMINYCVLSLNLKNCRLPLGMQSGEIPDDAVSASSSFDINTVGPKYSRIRTETNGGAWCPKSQIHVNSYEYLEIDLNNLTVITSVETQGRFGNGLGQEYAEYYIIEYKREDDKNWIRYHNRQGETIISGNSNTYIAEMREITPPILAKRIRFIPYSKVKRTICLRVEIYGCLFEDGIVWYQMPQGDRRNDIDFIDNSYDGSIDNNILKDGLGQLTDGELGDDDFRAETFYFGMKGYEWIGWKRTSERSLIHKLLNNTQIRSINGSAIDSSIASQTLPYVPLAFKFDYIRNFTSVFIHCNNMFTKDVQAFSKAIVQFSLNGVFNNNKHSIVKSQLVFEVPNDSHNESARFIKLELDSHIARFIRIKLYFSSKWLLISEVDFHSTVVPQMEILSKTSNNEIIETKTLNEQSSTAVTPETIPSTKSISSTTKGPYQTTSVMSQPIVSSSSPIKQYYFIILIISSLILISILGLIIAVILLNKQRYKNKSAKLQNILHQKHLYGNSSVYSNVPLNMNLTAELASFLKNQSKFDTAPKYLITPINGTKNTVILKTEPASFSTATTSLSSSSTSSEQKNTNSIFQPYHLFQPQATENSSVTDNESREYCSPDLITPTNQMPTIEIIKSLFHEIETKNSILNDTTPYASVDILDYTNMNVSYDSIQGVCGNVTYYVENKQEFIKLSISSENIHKVSTIEFHNQLSDGQFGKIYVVSTPRGVEKEKNSIAKMLINSSVGSNSTINKAQQSFLEELAIRTRLNHPNLANMIGYCENPYCLITEYKSELGHLDEYLKNNFQSIGYSSQLFILLQISKAMKYLEQLNVTHRDLAIRNCLVYDTSSSNDVIDYRNLNLKNISIKITDIAICLPEYRKDYHLHNNSKLLPIRYMPAEALFEGFYSPSSDVWSFGILIWQLFTNCKSIPFTEWSNNDYLYNLKLSMYSLVLTHSSDLKNDPLPGMLTLNNNNNNNKMLNNNFPATTQFSSLKGYHKKISQFKINDLSSSSSDTNKTKSSDSFITSCLNMTMAFNCTKEIHDLLIECCNMNTIRRPKFKDIYLFLQCKIFGNKL